MKLPDSFLDELRARTPLAPLIGRGVKLSRSGRQWKGCCPFHGEKTPSFYVYDDHYHCFGCGEHGDAVGFVMKSQGAAFMEAVEVLAREAGLELPKHSPEAAAAERQKLDLHGVLDAAMASYRRRLRAREGRPALDYLKGRGLSDDTIDAFGLGWSGEGRGALAAELAGAGITQAQLLEAGLLRAGEDGAIRGELFFQRVTFPIRDRQGRVISFGGRILGDGQPKYVNGPETKLFSKRRTLFGLDLARAAARKGAAVVAVEGYMDVIALHQAGFAGAVAPLGTALTEAQLEELWRLSPCPTLCFDGDAAGGRAAARAATVALPALTPDQSLKIATLPEGEDPDSLVRRQGTAGFAAILDAATPLGAALFDLLRETGGDASPEQRAAFRGRLEAAAATIRDKALAREYRSALLDRFFASSRKSQGRAAPGKRDGRQQARPTPDPRTASAERARALTGILINHPALLHDLEEAYGTLSLPPAMDRLRMAVLRYADAASELDSAGLITHLTQLGLANDLGIVLADLPSCARAGAQPAEAEAGWWHFYGLMDPGGLDEMVASAQRSFDQAPDAGGFARLNALLIARDRLIRGEPGGDAELDLEFFDS